MPPCFMARISRSSSGVVTAEPNHHQRIRMRESSGGRSKDWRTPATVSAANAEADSRRARQAKGPVPQGALGALYTVAGDPDGVDLPRVENIVERIRRQDE